VRGLGHRAAQAPVLQLERRRRQRTPDHRTWTLTAVAGGTHLRMEQSGFGPQDDNNYKGAAYGWQRNIETLEKVVAGLA
jgi:hypothetical protein